MAKTRYHDGAYAGYDARRKLEREDFGMISEDHSAVANMPQQVVMKSYPKSDYARYSGLDDTIRGIDVQIDKDASNKTIKKGAYPDMY